MSLDLRDHETTDPFQRNVPEDMQAALSQGQEVDSGRPLAIQVEHLSRLYKIRGDKKKKKDETSEQKVLTALDAVNLEVYEGELFGLACSAPMAPARPRLLRY